MKIERGLAQIRRALRIDKKLHPIALDHSVVRLFRIKRHLVLQAGTAALRDLNAQTLFRATLFLEQRTELPSSILRHVYHSETTYDFGVSSQPTRPDASSIFPLEI